MGALASIDQALCGNFALPASQLGMLGAIGRQKGGRLMRRPAR